jgi:hypothetical protein
VGITHSPSASSYIRGARLIIWWHFLLPSLLIVNGFVTIDGFIFIVVNINDFLAFCDSDIIVARPVFGNNSDVSITFFLVFEGPVRSGFFQVGIETATATSSIKFKNYIKLNRTAQNQFITVQTNPTTGCQQA